MIPLFIQFFVVVVLAALAWFVVQKLVKDGFLSTLFYVIIVVAVVIWVLVRLVPLLNMIR